MSDLTRTLAARVFGDRPAPVGAVARDRRLLKRALTGRSLGRVLVVGPGLAARQVLRNQPRTTVDVAGILPYPEVTVCSAVDGVDSLPPARWDTAIITEPGLDLSARLRAVLPACRAGATLLVLDRGPWQAGSGEVEALGRVAAEPLVAPGSLRVWMAVVRP